MQRTLSGELHPVAPRPCGVLRHQVKNSELKDRLLRYRKIKISRMTRSAFSTLILGATLLGICVQSQTSREALVSSDNAYNPIPSPGGKYIAYVRTGWGRQKGFSGFGRSNLVSEVAVLDASESLVFKNPLANAFLSGWTPDSAKLICYRDGAYSLVSKHGVVSSEGRLPGSADVIGTERVSYLPRSGLLIWSRRDKLHTILETPKGILAK
jgi:hypothetical protein